MREERHERVTAIVEANAPDLLAYFLRRVAVVEDAADLLSETLLLVWRRAGRLPTEEDEVRPWLFGVARNVLRHHRRSGARRSALADRLRDEIRVQAAPVDARNSDLGEALAALADTDRELLTLIHWDGFGVAEAGAVVGLRPEAARSRVHRARRRLRAALAPTGSPAL